MEMRREVKLREVGKEPKKLQALQKALKEKDESLTFFDLRIEQSRSLLAELQLLTPETEEDQPAFDRRFKLRTARRRRRWRNSRRPSRARRRGRRSSSRRMPRRNLEADSGGGRSSLFN